MIGLGFLCANGGGGRFGCCLAGVYLGEGVGMWVSTCLERYEFRQVSTALSVRGVGDSVGPVQMWQEGGERGDRSV